MGGIMKKIILLVVILAVALSSCNYLQPTGDVITGEIVNTNNTNTNNTNTTAMGNQNNDNSGMVDKNTDSSTNQAQEPTGSMMTVEKIEGDLIKLTPDAYDPDGDTVTYEFSEPFDKNGEWQTAEGDAGNYEVTVTATDGKLSTTEKVLVVVKPTNKAPIIDCPNKITVLETETVDLNCNISDPEGKDVTVMYDGWIGSTPKKTGYDDAEVYSVTITANDGEKIATKTVEIEVLNKNRAPQVDAISADGTITVEEGETAAVNINAVDPEGDRLTYKYSEPFNNKGEWQTKLGDAGTYDASVTVSDGESTTKVDFKVVVTQKNTAPTLEYIEPIIVDEGDTVKLNVNAYDREGDKVTIKISGWMNSEEYTTTYDDAGEHTVIVEATDGELTSRQEVKVTVNNKNRPPVFNIPA